LQVAAITPRRSTRMRVSTYKVKSASSEGENSDSGTSKTDSENLTAFASPTTVKSIIDKPKSTRKSKVLKAQNINATLQNEQMERTTDNSVEEKLVEDEVVQPTTENSEIQQERTPVNKDNDEYEAIVSTVEKQATVMEPDVALDEKNDLVGENEEQNDETKTKNVLKTVIPTEKRKSENNVRLSGRQSKKFKVQDNATPDINDEREEIKNQISPSKVSSPKLAIIEQHQSPVKPLEVPILEKDATDTAESPIKEDQTEVMPVEEPQNYNAVEEEMPEVVANEPPMEMEMTEDSEEIVVSNEVANVEEQHEINEIPDTMDVANAEEIPDKMEVEKSEDTVEVEMSEIVDGNEDVMEVTKPENSDEPQDELTKVIDSNEVDNVEEQHEINEMKDEKNEDSVEAEMSDTIDEDVMEVTKPENSDDPRDEFTGVCDSNEVANVEHEINEKTEDKLDRVMINLVDEDDPIEEKIANKDTKPVARKKKVNTINLITPGTEKRIRSANKKVIEILDSPDSNPKTTMETSIVKSASVTKNRMTRATFLSGCNDSIYIHAENLLLKSCRKRSQSFCIDDHSKSIKKNNRVQFYSPLNMEIDIPTIDTRLQQNTTISECAESIGNFCWQLMKFRIFNYFFVLHLAGKRRKRSMSEPNMNRTIGNYDFYDF
jgi:hypothetical protein